MSLAPRAARAVTICLSAGLLACTTSTGVRLKESIDFGVEESGIWVRGPWEAVTPSKDLDEIIDQLCPAVMRLDRARERDYGLEYCGLLYSLPDGTYYASSPAGVEAPGSVVPSLKKSCRMPRMVRDERDSTTVIADYHSHPWANSPFGIISPLPAVGAQ